MPIISPEDFWKAYSEECKKNMNKRVYNEIYLKEYTSNQMKILEKIGIKFGFKEYNITKEANRVDMGYFSYPENANESGNPADDEYYKWDWDVAIEHENDQYLKLCWRDELIKLWHIACGLKVLITYNSFQNKSISDLENIILKIIGERKYKNVFDEKGKVIQTPFLFIFFPSCPDNDRCWGSSDGMYDAVALVYDEAGFRQLENLPILRTNANIKNLSK